MEADVLTLVLAAACAALLVRRRRGSAPDGARAPAWRTVGKALLLAASLLLLAENALRVHERLGAAPTFRPDARRFWAVEPNLRDHLWELGPTLVSTNELGLREVEVPFAREPGELRLLCMGDSWTFGQGVAVDETFVKRLQALLRQALPGRRVTVVNCGVPGYSWFQAYHSADEWLAAWRPDVVLLCGFNEFSSVRIPEMERLLPEESLRVRLSLLLWESRLYRVLRRALGLGAQPGAEGPAVPRAEPERAGPANMQPPIASRKALERYRRALVARVRRTGAPVLMFDHAFQAVGSESARQEYLVRSARDLGDGVVWVRLCPRRRTDPPPMLPGDDLHPDARGHDRMARALLRVLQERMPEALAPTAPGP